MNLRKLAKKYIGKIKRKVYKSLYKYIPVDEKIILFIAFHGRGYLCNPKYIHKHLINDNSYKDYTFVWALNKEEIRGIPNSKVVKYNGIKYLYYLAKSKYWIANCKLPKYIIKKENQIYIQTWHGTPLKRLAHDIHLKKETTFYRTKINKGEMTNTYDIDVKRYDYFISPNKYSTEKFLTAFNLEPKTIIEKGYPRNDYLINIKEKEIIELKNKFNIPKDKKVILYAPTWRDNSYNNKGYVFKLQVDFKLWKKRLGNEYVVIFKPHYLIINSFDKLGLEDFLYTVRENEDINELYAISDILITDYSSVFFDYSILEKPILFYMYDIEDYRDNLRGFYLDINKSLPGPIITKETSLLDCILDLKEDRNKYISQLKKFNEEYNYLQNGNSAKAILDIVLKQG